MSTTKTQFSKRPFWIFLFAISAPALAILFATIYQGVQGGLETRKAHQEQVKELYQTSLSSYQRGFRALSDSAITSSLARALHFKGVDPRTNTTLSQWRVRFEKKAQSFQKQHQGLHSIVLFHPEKDFLFDTTNPAVGGREKNIEKSRRYQDWLYGLADEESLNGEESFISFSGEVFHEASHKAGDRVETPKVYAPKVYAHFVYPLKDQEETFEGSEGFLVFSLEAKSLLKSGFQFSGKRASNVWVINQNASPLLAKKKEKWLQIHDQGSGEHISENTQKLKASLREIKRFQSSQILSQGADYAIVSTPIYPYTEDLSKTWYLVERVSLMSLFKEAFIERLWMLWIFMAFVISSVFMMVTSHDERIRPLEEDLKKERSRVESLLQLKKQMKENLSHHRLISSRLAEHLREFRQGFDEQGENFLSWKELKDNDQKEFDRLKELVQILKEGVKEMANLDELSFQAHLISFNASIEASRAGHSAKGLRVVANELQDFHQKSQETLKDLRQTLSGCFERAEVMSQAKFSILKDEDSLLRSLDDLGNELQERLELLSTESDESLFWHKRLFNDLIRKETRDLFSDTKEDSVDEQDSGGQEIRNVA